MPASNETRVVRRLYHTIFPIQAISVSLTVVNTLITSLIVSRCISTPALAAIGFVAPLELLLATIGTMLASGAQLLTAQSLGRGSTSELRGIYSTVLSVCAAAGILFALTSLAFPAPIAALLGATGEDAALTAQYLRGRAIGFPFTLLLSCLLPYLELNHSGRVSILSVGTMLLIGLAGNLLSALVLKAGLFGAGLVCSVATLVAAAIAFAHLQRRSHMFRFSIGDFRIPLLRSTLYIGFPSGLNKLCLAVSSRVMNQMTFALGGEVALAALEIARELSEAVGAAIEDGYIGSCRMIGSLLYGERDSSSLRDLPKVMAGHTWPLFAGAYVLILVLARPLALLFGAPAEDIHIYTAVLRLSCLIYLTSILTIPPLTIYHVMGRIRLSSRLTVLGSMVFPILVCLVFGHALRWRIVVSAPWIGSLLLLIVLAALFTSKAGRLPRSPLELCYIPSSISAPREDRFKAVIATEQDAVTASKQIMEFCLSKGLPSRTATYCGLCVEELAVDTVRHRFQTPDSTIDLRAIYENDGIWVLLRDDCPHFDPMEWLKLCAPKEPERSIGIRMVTRLAEDMSYTHAFGINALTFRLRKKVQN